MRYAGILLLILFSLNTAVGSSPWIKPGMHYFKIKIGKGGIYRLSQNDIDQALSSAGFSAQSVDSTKWALFFRGEETAIQYDNGDILFYGQKNDAALDTGLYFDGGVVNTLINTHSDTTAYFLSWYQDNRTGKRIQDLQVSSPNNVIYHFEKKVWEPDNYRYFVGENYFSTNAASLLYGSFQPGEGWVGTRSTSSVPMVFDSINQRNSTISAPILELHYTAEDKLSNSGDIILGSNSPRTWKNSIGFNGVQPILAQGTIFHSDIENNTLSTELSISVGAFSSVYGVLLYPQNIGMFGSTAKTFLLDSGGSAEKRIQITDLSISSASQVIAWDITNPNDARSCDISFNASNNTLSISVNGADTVRRRIQVELKAQITEPAIPYFRDFQDLTNPDQDFLIVYPEEFDSAANAYFSYRQSAAGGSFSPLRMEVEEVYDQFSFGEFTPVGIHEFCRYMNANSTASSNYLFLLGKGLQINIRRRVSGVFYSWRFRPELFSYKNLIPTFGVPGGDWPYTMNFDPNNPKHPQFGVGRITSRTQNQVFDYLEKIKEYEDPANNGLWRKRLLHLSGGVTDQEVQRFYGYINEFKDIAENEILGGRVQSISKTNPSGVQTILVDTVINEGISVLTMYGHSSIQFSDIQIGDVNDPNLNYDNSDGQYPMFIINGCETGRIYEEFESWAQSWVNTPSKGASIVISHTFEGFDPILKYYTEEIYKTAFADTSFFGAPIGDIMTQANRRFYDQFSPFWGPFIQAQVEVMNFQGDPSLRISSGLGLSDYALSEPEVSAISFTQNQITTNTDSFQLKIPLANFGRKTDQVLGVLVERISPEPVVFDTLWINAFGYSDTAYYTIYNSPNPEGLGGLNTYSISIDPSNLIDESDKANNLGTFELLIPNQAVRNIRPSNFGIVSTQNTRLVSSGILGDNEASINYVFELDTSYTFNSSFKKTYQTTGGVISFWDVSLADPGQTGDSVVYYWRSKKLEDTVWSESSFTFIPSGSAGWSQSEYGQYVVNEVSGGLQLKDSTVEFSFTDFSSDIDVLNAGRLGPFLDTTSIRVGNALLMKRGPLSARNCAANRLLFVRISGQTGQAYRDLTFWDGRNCGIEPFAVRQLANIDITRDTIATSFLNYLNSVKDEDYILLISHGIVNYNLFSSELRDSLAQFGLDTGLWDQIGRFEPFIFLGKKGEQGVLSIADTSLSQALDSQVLNFDYILTEFNRSGTMQSGRIGPAQNWGSMNLDIEAEGNDSTRVSIVGVKLNGEEQLLRPDLEEGNSDLNDISAIQFPWIRLEAYFEDTLDRSSPQLNKWQVFYQGAAEGVLDPLAFGEGAYDNISIQEGDTIRIPFSFKNISEFDFGSSLKVTFTIDETSSSEITIPAIASGDSSIFEYELITQKDMSGDYQLRIFVNPFEIPELYYDNNIYEVQYSIFPDEIPPTLSVTIDGNRIANGDVVRYNPEIRMVMADENPFLDVLDSGSIFFTLYRKLDLQDSIIQITEESILWYPESDTSDFTLLVNPDSLEDGEYLLEFNGRDASGNLAGPFPKSVEFEIQTGQPAIAEDIKIFPNPFTSTLELQIFIGGNSIPEKAEIRIFDLQGKRIYQSDLKNTLKLGSNRIDIWEGRDFEGHMVPSGIYIYHFDIRGDGIENSIGSPLIGKVLYQP